MGYRNTKVDVEMALKDLNAAAEDLGLDRRFEMRYGSSINGVAHVLEEIHPGLVHPTGTPIGKTFRQVHDYLIPMTHALRSVKRDRDYRREDLTDPRLQGLEGRDPNGYPRGMLAPVGVIPGISPEVIRLMNAPVNSVGIFDPDRRQQEDLATRPPEADQ